MKSTIFSIVIAVIIVGAAGFIALSRNSKPEVASVDNVTVTDGVQVVDVTAKGDYSPRLTEAKAGLPTTLRVATNGTFDCSSQLTVPSLGYRKQLPPTGITDIPLPPQKAGSTLSAVCGMGMKSFQIKFD